MKQLSIKPLQSVFKKPSLLCHKLFMEEAQIVSSKISGEEVDG
ncbi:hypothetical protein [Candidatus Borrarchaeum sp.]|nr:hypothetical protein [Candidatus Borrarchaeum sp.]